MKHSDRIYVAGHQGLVGSALIQRLTHLGYTNLLTQTKEELNLLDSPTVKDFFHRHPIDYVFMAAGKVGGILANMREPADFCYENALMALNVIHSAAQTDVKKLLYLGSSCVYPRIADRAITEKDLLSSPLEKSNEGYALAKILGVKLCELMGKQFGKSFISVMPTNLYGPDDDFDLQSSHVIPGMMHRMHLAKINNASLVTLWGTGNAKREFLHVDDCADACIFIMNHYSDTTQPINLGYGSDLSIRQLALLMREVVGYEGTMQFGIMGMDGTPQKLLDSSRLFGLGWTPRWELKQGLKDVYTKAKFRHLY